MDRLINQLIKNNYSLKAEGESMKPLLLPDDNVFIKKVGFNKLQIGDIIVYKKNKRLITHRLIYKNKQHVITKGDNNLECDHKLLPKQIVGKVIKIKRDNIFFIPEQLYLIQSTHYLNEIIKLKQKFEKNNIDHVFLKGLPIHLFYENTHPKRFYADCDVLIDKKDFLKAEKIIEKEGYKKTFKQTGLVENNYFKIINGFSVIFDLHLEPAFLMTQFSGLEALYPQKLIDGLTEELLTNKKQIKIDDTKYYILDTNYLILYLALHLFHHNFRGAFRYQFLDTVIKKSRLSKNDWQNIQLTINKYQLTNFVSPVFILLKKHYQTPIAQSFLKQNKSPITYHLSPISALNIFNDEPRVKAGINRFLNILVLSSNPWWKKIFVFLNPNVAYFICLIIWKKLFSFFSNRRTNLLSPS